MLRRLFTAAPAEGGSSGRVEMRLGSGFVAHLVASYGVGLAVWGIAVARGAAATALLGWAMLAPVSVPIWLFVVTPLVLAFEHTGRVSAEVLPGAPNTPVAAAAWVVYLSLFVVAYRRVHGHRVRTLRRALGQCLRCGYDLRGTPERCPECGAVPGATISN